VDLTLQIGQMRNIYSSAHLTLIAVAGPDEPYGLTSVTHSREDCAKWEDVGSLQDSRTRNYQDSHPKRKPNTFQDTWEIPQGYTPRTLSCDADGVKAIYGALETMSQAELPAYRI
jgi:hypothetical protein